MSILIESMEMPKSCYVCPFCDYVSARCDAVKGNPYTPESRYEKRADFCPLVPVPAHGRLIDADKQDTQIEALIERHLHGYTKSTWDFVCELRDILKRNHTVIPAESSEALREYETAVEQVQYCELHEPTYDPDTGAL